MRELFDRVRNLYGYATAYNSDPNLKHLQKLRDHNLAEFDRMIAQIRKEAKAEALRDFADAHRMPWIIFRDKDGNPVTVSDLMRETAKNYLDKETRND